MTDSEKDRNPYLGWTLERLQNHKEKIEAAIVNAEQEIRNQLLNTDIRFSPDHFREIHSGPSCQIIPVKVGEKDVDWSGKGDTFHLDYFALQCLTHNTKSTQYSLRIDS